MRQALPYFDSVVRSVPTTMERCLRATQLVASLWTLAGITIMFLLSGRSSRVEIHIFAIGCLLIGSGLYSLLIPFRHILRPPKTD